MCLQIGGYRTRVRKGESVHEFEQQSYCLLGDIAERYAVKTLDSSNKNFFVFYFQHIYNSFLAMRSKQLLSNTLKTTPNKAYTQNLSALYASLLSSFIRLQLVKLSVSNKAASLETAEERQEQRQTETER